MASFKAKDHSKEDRLLLSLIKEGSAASRLDEMVASGLDWDYLLERARGEGVFYPFYKKLVLLDEWKNVIAENIRERFKQTHYIYLSKSAGISRQITQILGHLDSLNIKMLLFKGPAVDSLIYDGFFRPRLDLDIVVRDEDMSAMEKALSGLGYLAEQEEKDYPLPEYLNSKLFMNSPRDLMPLHIHRHLINNMFLTVDNALSMDMKKVWDQTEPFRGYRHIAILKPELNIIYLCEHALKHNFDQMVFLHEIDRLIRHYKEGFDWKGFVALAGGFGLGRVVYYGLRFVKEVLSGDVPDEVIDALKPKKITVGEKIFIKDTLHKKHRRYSSYPVYLANRDGLLKKSNFLFRTVFPPGFTPAGCIRRARRLILH